MVFGAGSLTALHNQSTSRGTYNRYHFLRVQLLQLQVCAPIQAGVPTEYAVHDYPYMYSCTCKISIYYNLQP